MKGFCLTACWSGGSWGSFYFIIKSNSFLFTICRVDRRWHPVPPLFAYHQSVRQLHHRISRFSLGLNVERLGRDFRSLRGGRIEFGSVNSIMKTSVNSFDYASVTDCCCLLRRCWRRRTPQSFLISRCLLRIRSRSCFGTFCCCRLE